MKRNVVSIVWLFSILLSLMVACQRTPSANVAPQTDPSTPTPLPTMPLPTPTIQLLTYPELDANVANPGRGWFVSYDLPGNAGFSGLRSMGVSLVHLQVHLDPWREEPIPDQVLKELEAHLEEIRAQGLKAIFRFSYNQGPYPNSEPDASLEQILAHLDQLQPLFQNRADVIAWVEAGFIGAWGEWHSSTHGLDQNMEAKQAVVQKWLEVLPPPRVVQLRYPPDIMRMFPQPLGEDLGFTDAPQARVGHHNDCFLADETDRGTYPTDPEARKEQKAYLSQLTRFTPMSGETCNVHPRNACEIALQEMALLHFTALHQGYHRGVYRVWKKEGCFDEITRRLGYRLVLRAAQIPNLAPPGGQIDVQVHFENVGFAAPLLPREFYVVLKDAQGQIWKTALHNEVDPRRWEPGRYALQLSLGLPQDLPEGRYTLGLWLPDPAPALQQDPRYALRFVNQEVWDSDTGINQLGTLYVAASAPGDRYQTGSELSLFDLRLQQERAPLPPIIP